MKRILVVLFALAIFLFLPKEVFAVNLLTNPGFEDGTSSWSKYGGTLEIVSDYVHSGTEAARLTSATTSTKWIYQIISVVGGTAYVFSGYLIKNSPNISSALLRIAWYNSSDGSGSELSHTDSTDSLINDNAEYRLLSTEAVVAPDDVHSARVKAVFVFDSTAQTFAYFDDFIFEETALPTPIPTIPSPTHTPVPPTPTPTVTPTTVPKATYKINEVKDTDGNILSSVKIYVDGNYVHHYTPETITFCENCQCYTDVNCHFGSHLIKLEKANYADWAESKTFNSGDNYEVNPIMQVLSLTASASSTPTPTVRVSSPPTPSPTIKPTNGEILGAEDASESFELALNDATDSSLPDDGDATVAGVAKSNKLPPSWPFIGVGSTFLAAMVGYAVMIVRRKLPLP